MNESFTTPPSYSGDREMELLLKRTGARIGLFGVYGLFYGCLAATYPVSPVQYMPVIFGEEGIAYDTEGIAEAVLRGLKDLWNTLARWNPEQEPFIFPDAEYPKTSVGLLLRLRDDAAMIEYFMEGLVLGRTSDEDLVNDAYDALLSLTNIKNLIEQYMGALEAGEEESAGREKTRKLFDDVEDTMADAMTRIAVGLKVVRQKTAAERGALFQEKGDQVAGPDDFCPCGSGRAYRRCCGITH